MVKQAPSSPTRAPRLNCLWLLALGGACLLAWPVRAQPEAALELSEFLAANAKTRADEDGEFVDWIEIRNSGTAAANLEAWSLTDNAATLAKWVFPSTNLPAGGYLVVFASGKDRRVPGRPLHTNFSLDADGEYLALVSPEGEVATQFAPAFPKQKNDVSYGLRAGTRVLLRPADARGGEHRRLQRVCRGHQVQPRPRLSHRAVRPRDHLRHGGATIRYTTNGTLPALTNGFTYSSPIRIAGTTVLRAAAFKTGYQPSNVDTQTYLFLDDVIRQSPTGAAPARLADVAGARTCAITAWTRTS